MVKIARSHYWLYNDLRLMVDDSGVRMSFRAVQTLIMFLSDQ